ncbi:MAG: Bax inhibitor-1/YccA family protein [Candidatus Woesearchaeota archaeon]|jgi:uncharacterized YccA/Bax inhibitor family protein|nr:Bax inhibitor-1/YccA family protein [Candidatus Woesearchaeota archaeon]
MLHNKSTNIAMKSFNKISHSTNHDPMTLEGSLNKTLILLTIVLFTGYFGWTQSLPIPFIVLFIISLVISIIIAITLAFKPLIAKYLAPIYAIFQGYFLGAISVLFESWYPGIVIQAILITVSIAFLMNFLYRKRIIVVTEKFKAVIIAATMGIFFVYMISLAMSFFTSSGIPLIHESGLIGIGFSLLVVTIASLNLLLDFSFIEEQSKRKVTKDMEWYGAFALTITLIWIYVEILKLLAKLKSRD